MKKTRSADVIQNNLSSKSRKVKSDSNEIKSGTKLKSESTDENENMKNPAKLELVKATVLVSDKPNEKMDLDDSSEEIDENAIGNRSGSDQDCKELVVFEEKEITSISNNAEKVFDDDLVDGEEEEEEDEQWDDEKEVEEEIDTVKEQSTKKIVIEEKNLVDTPKEMGEIEKTVFILEQVRLCLDCQDYERAKLLSRMINPKVFEIGSLEMEKKPKRGFQTAAEDILSLLELKKIYYQQMIRYHSNGNDYLEIFKCYKAVYETELVKEDPQQWMPILKKMCWYLVLLPYGPTRSALINSLLLDKNLSEIPKSKLLLKRLSTAVVRDHFAWGCPFHGGFDHEIEMLGGSFGRKANEDIIKRQIEHNIMVVANQNARLTFAEFSKDVGPVDIQEAMVNLREMIASKAVVAKIDEASRMVYFPNADAMKYALATRDELNEITDLIEQVLDLKTQWSS